MWPFRRRPRFIIPEGCDFELARKELADFFKMTNDMAKAQGGTYMFKREFSTGWNEFKAKPCRETAETWIAASPDYLQLFQEQFTSCSPGGTAFNMRQLLKKT
jgi:hypothetical protein